MSFGFDERFDADWIYAADFAGCSNAVYLGSYSGRLAMIDAEGEARQVYDVGVPPERIIDTGEFFYILTQHALYVLRHGSLETIVDLLDGGRLVMAGNGFGMLETKRLRWFAQDGKLLGTVMSADPIRRIYQSGEGLIVESRLRRATIGGTPRGGTKHNFSDGLQTGLSERYVKNGGILRSSVDQEPWLEARVVSETAVANRIRGKLKSCDVIAFVPAPI